VELAKQLTLCPSSIPNVVDHESIVSQIATSDESATDDSSVVVGASSMDAPVGNGITSTSIVKASLDLLVPCSCIILK